MVASAEARTVGVRGIAGDAVTVYVRRQPGARMEITGLPPTAAAGEIRTRVVYGLRNGGGMELNAEVKVSPAGGVGRGLGIDLAIAAAAIAIAADTPIPSDLVFFGEIALDGRVRHVPGVTVAAVYARGIGARLVCPSEDVAEAAIILGGAAIGVDHVLGLARVVGGTGADVEDFRAKPEADPWPEQEPPGTPDFSDVIGHHQAVRALEIAAAGFHNVLMVGPAGSGRTMLARRMTSILPPMTRDEAETVASIWSVVGQPGQGRSRPFRAPHHTVSDAGMIGGGPNMRPGEVTLAHGGVLFLDELPEMRRDVLDAVTATVIDREVSMFRGIDHWRYPADFHLVAAAASCPCGREPACTCTPDLARRYLGRIERFRSKSIDITVRLQRQVTGLVDRVMSGVRAEPSAVIRGRVIAARHLLESQWPSTHTARARGVDQPARIKVRGDTLPPDQQIARTIAALDGRTTITDSDLEEARGLTTGET